MFSTFVWRPPFWIYFIFKKFNLKKLFLNFCFIFLKLKLSARIFKIECIKANETKYLKNIECKINRIKNGIYTVSIYGDLVAELDYILASFEAVHKNSQKVLVNLTGEYCSFYGRLLPVVQIAIDLANKYQKNLFHQCPYTPGDRLGLVNFPGNEVINKISNFFPGYFKVGRGEYTGTYRSKDRNGNTIFGFKGFVSVSQKKSNKNW